LSISAGLRAGYIDATAEWKKLDLNCRNGIIRAKRAIDQVDRKTAPTKLPALF
jgi:hypothetical protein